MLKSILQWSEIDLEKGLGGVEVCAREIARGLEKKGCGVFYSSDLTEINGGSHDAVITHGSSFPINRRIPKSKTWIHILHGTTLGRMIACREFFWLRGYYAYFKEVFATIKADVLISVNAGLHLIWIRRLLRKKTIVQWNGWDTSDDAGSQSVKSQKVKNGGSLSSRSPAIENPYFVFIGRSHDSVKNAELIESCFTGNYDFDLAVVPGFEMAGLENGQLPRIHNLGSMNSKEIKTLLGGSIGLLVLSKYEGCPIVVMEALSEGVSVVATGVGALPEIAEKSMGLIITKPEREEVIQTLRLLAKDGITKSEKSDRKKFNRAILPPWEKFAKAVLDAILDDKSGVDMTERKPK